MDEYQKAVFDGGQKIYDQIASGTFTGDVEAALMDVELEASEVADTPDN